MADTLNRIVAVPNWSFFDPPLCVLVERELASFGVQVHYVQGDLDHQRTVTAFSGSQPTVFAAAFHLARFLLPKIDLRKQDGVHPRIGAMDVAPFVLLDGDEGGLIEECRNWASSFSSEFHIPIHLYEKAAVGENEHRLPYLRGQMLGALEPLSYDFGTQPHDRWGVSIVGVRDFLLATNIDVDTADASLVQAVAREIRNQREEGNPRFAGVRALRFALRSRGIIQLSLNLTQPDDTSFDDLYEYAEMELGRRGVNILGTELIGVIRDQDTNRATRLTFDQRQVVS